MKEILNIKLTVLTVSEQPLYIERSHSTEVCTVDKRTSTSLKLENGGETRHIEPRLLKRHQCVPNCIL